MRIMSRAGNFNMTIDEVTVENGELVMIGKMGVWSAKTMLSVDELRTMLRGMTVSPKVLDFGALFLFRYMVTVVEEDRTRRREATALNSDGPGGQGPLAPDKANK
jgi:hypothetical protein